MNVNLLTKIILNNIEIEVSKDGDSTCCSACCKYLDAQGEYCELFRDGLAITPSEERENGAGMLKRCEDCIMVYT